MKRRDRVAILAAGAAGTVTALLAGTSRRIHRDSSPQPLQKADAILVFGAAVWPTGPSPSLQVRVARAAELHAEGWAPVILCSGGLSHGISEAMTMRRMLLERGVPASAIIPDDGGTTTRDALRCAGAFGAGRWRRIIAVSSSYHMHRIRLESARQDLDVILCPAFRSGPSTRALRAFDRRQHRRELLAVVAYACRSRVDAAIDGRFARFPRAAVRQLIGRVKYLASAADAVTDASDAVSQLIKSASNQVSDAQSTLTPAAAGLAWPVPGSITSPFGLRHRRLHSGIDIRAAYGCPIRSAAAGLVIVAGPLGPYGNVTVVDHGSGLSTVYAHQAGIIIDQGAAVTSGQVLGYVGTTGPTSAPHLHFEVRVHGSPVDPVAYLS
jgi:murein DD-endopeptidase MepM/ murein hydrolase activator NlpD